ncbi:MAG TPA: helix-turn-helix transcriptional regulator, partial [Phycicoccus sp.]|nr:helix-turn-helix transcriptional regulator [Phycicoccus sp.]
VAVGTWPETGAEVEPIGLTGLRGTEVIVRTVVRGGVVRGALTANRTGAQPLSPSENRLLADLAGQAGLVIEHLSVTDLLEQQAHRRLPQLTARENEVLELMARGLSNAAICEQLHLSIKTVEPVVSSIFTKLGLQAESSSNRRVLAVVEFLRSREA